MERARRQWRELEERARRGEQPIEYIGRLPDSDLVKLLAASPIDRGYERNVLMTELLNRASRRAQRLPAGARETAAAVERALDVATRTGLPPEVHESLARAADAARRHAEDIERLVDRLVTTEEPRGR